MASKQRGFFRKLSRLFRYGSQHSKGKNARGYDTTIAQMRRGTISVVQKSQSPSFANMTGNVYNLTERLMRYQDFCLAAGTLVYTLDGVQTIRDLAEKHPNGERFFVYSYDYELKRPVIGTAFMPRIANGGAPSKRLRITFDDGGHLDCTPDHRVILRDGSTREAGELRADDSLMPLYVSDINGYGYNWTYMLGADYDGGANGWLQEHCLVADQFYGHIPSEHDVHHRDFVKKNNHPSNLQVMHEHDHRSYHAQLNNVSKFGKLNAAHSAWMRENSQNKRNDVTFKAIVDACLLSKSALDVQAHLNADANVIKNRLKQHRFKNWEDLIARFDEAQQVATHDAICEESRTPSLDEILLTFGECASLDELASKLSCTRNAVNRRLQASGIMGGWTELKTGAAYIGKKRGPTYDGPTYQAFCSAYKPGMTQLELATMLGTTKNKLGTCLKNAGYLSFTKWTQQFKNHKVASVTEICDDVVYTITVEKHHNLAVGSESLRDTNKRPYSMIFVTQCEMEYTPELASALDIYADESVAGDEKDRVFHIFSTNEAIKQALEDLFYNVLNVEFNLRGWVRNLVKYGDLFLLNELNPDHGIVRVVPLPVNEIEREEGYDPQDPALYRFRWVTLGNRELDCWQVTHMRLLGNDQFLPYGMSVIESARRIWRQLILIEDAMLTYRIVRAPERRVFYIDVGNTPPEEVPLLVEDAKRNIRSSPVVDRTSGRVDLRYNPVSIEEDFWIPVRGTETGTKIETLQGGQNAAAVEDVQYIQRKLFAAIKIPKAYLGYDDMLSSKATLAQEDIRFSRTIAVIQKTVIAEMNRLAIMHLYCLGFPEQELQDFSLRLSNPSTVAQQQKLELLRAKAEIAGAFPDGMVDKEWVRKEVIGFTDEHIARIDERRLAERIMDAKIEAAGEPPEEGGGGGGGGGGSLFGEPGGSPSGDLGGAEGELGATAAGEPPGGGQEEPAAGEEPEADVNAADDAADDELDEPDVTLLMSADDPAEPTERDRATRRAKRKRHHGASALAEPDFSAMLQRAGDADPFDSHWLRQAGKNPLAEHADDRPRTSLPADLAVILRKLPRRERGLLT
jgi:hypothetical protein